MQQIAEWLAKMGLERYAPAFVENDIDVSVLRYLTDADLEKIGGSLGHRRKLLAAIAELGGGPPAPTPPAPEPRKQDAERTGPTPRLGPAPRQDEALRFHHARAQPGRERHRRAGRCAGGKDARVAGL